MARQSAQWPWEIRRGRVTPLADQGLRRRCEAARLTLLFEPAAIAAGAWVSTEVVVRVGQRPETVLRPVLAILTGEPTYDGVVEQPPLLVLEVGEGRRELWPPGSAGVLWTVGADGVAVDRTGRPSSFAGLGKSLKMPGVPRLRVEVATLCGMAAAAARREAAAGVPPREEAMSGHPH